MADNHYITFRPRNDQRASFALIDDWCIENEHSVSCIFNAFVDAIAYALVHSTFWDDETQRYYIRADFGDVPITNNKGGSRRTWQDHVNSFHAFKPNRKKKLKKRK